MTGWHQAAECATAGLPTDVWFDPGHERLALQICAECPVRVACLTAALEEESGIRDRAQGIRGGLTAVQRMNLASPRSRPVLDHPTIPHGMFRLYQKGCRCAACTEANSIRSREFYDRRRTTKAGGA